MPLPIQIISDEEAEKVGFVVCCREGTPSPFTDNETGICSECNHPIFYRPHVPKRPAKICMECLLDRARGGHA